MAESEFKFGVNELADSLGIEPASVRVKLRNIGEEKAGRSYGWNSQKAFDAVVKRLAAAPTRAVTATENKKAAAAAEKPARKNGRAKAAAVVEAEPKSKKALKPAKRGRKAAAAAAEEVA